MQNLRQALNNPKVLSDLHEWVDKLLESFRLQLEGNTDPVNIYRLQGQITSLKRFRKLRDELNDGK